MKQYLLNVHKKVALLYACFFLTGLAFIESKASDIHISNVEWAKSLHNDFSVRFTIEWNNAWRNDKNFDAAWVFIKYTSPEYHLLPYAHGLIANAGHKLLSNEIAGCPDPEIQIPSDKTGFFIYASKTHRGPVRWTINILLDTNALLKPEFELNNRLVEISAIEMVYVPTSAFYLGDGDTTSLAQSAFYTADGNGQYKGLFKVNNEKPIQIGPGLNELYYRSQKKEFQGDQQGALPETFPKGYKAFFIMKYELNQGQYADFLNCLSPGATQFRANYASKNYYKFRGSISLSQNIFIAGSAMRPCNFISWDDACAYADWAALRPFTELEYEKSCRGPDQPGQFEFPWNNNSKDHLKRFVHPGGDLSFSDLEEKNINDNNRELYGASFYRVMDMAGSLWERCITVGDSVGRAFEGTHGDGRLSAYAAATNADWPVGYTQSKGFGFRGGGYYEDNMLYGVFNPHSPIGFRNFAAWPGAYRYHAYGSRFARTEEGHKFLLQISPS